MVRTGEDLYEVRIDQEVSPPPRTFYEVRFSGVNPTNLKMNTGQGGPEYSEWPPVKVDGDWILQGLVGKGRDAFQVESMTKAHISLIQLERDDAIQFFDMYYKDEFEGKSEELLGADLKEYTWYVSPWANPMVRNSAIGVGVIAAGLAITKALEWW